MMRTNKADSARRLTVVPLALALSALMLISGQALADKPVPFIGAHAPKCSGSNLDRAEVHGAQFDLSSNKGRWIFVHAQFKVGDDPEWSNYYPADPPVRVETNLLVMSRTAVDPEKPTSFRLGLMDRKGGDVTDWTEVLDVDC